MTTRPLVAIAEQLERLADRPLTPHRDALRVLAAHFRKRAALEHADDRRAA